MTETNKKSISGESGIRRKVLSIKIKYLLFRLESELVVHKQRWIIDGDVQSNVFVSNCLTMRGEDCMRLIT